MPAQDVVRYVVAHRASFYILFTVVSVAVVIANALKNYSNFYSVTIYLSKSNRSVVILTNFSILVALLCNHIVQQIFFGALRPNEVERLYDRLWFFVTESLLAFTIFRDEFNMSFAAMFGFLLFVKSFHWLASDRIEWMDQQPYPGPSLLFHVRMVALFLILWVSDFLMFIFAVDNTATRGVGGMVLFATEYGILMASSMDTILKYFLSSYELRRAGRRGGENAPPWENKSMWVFYIELGTDFLKLTTYLVFFIIIVTFYGFPFNIIRDVYITARSFVTRLQALHRYQIATRNMDQLYPSATPEELAATNDPTCIICREEMVLPVASQEPAVDGPNTTPKKLPCGHIFHFYCLRSWLERQQSCPTCRRNVLETNPPSDTQANAGGAVNPAPGVPPNNPNANAQNRNVNPIQVQGRRNQGGHDNNALGNPFGFVGRLFGPPVPQANQGGAFGQARLPQMGAENNNNNLNNNLGAGVNNLNAAFPLGMHIGPGFNNAPGQIPPGIVIQYQIQYLFPRGQGQQAARALHPLPAFPGFPGPRGAWRPWPGGAQQQAPIPSPTQPQSQTTASTSPVFPTQAQDPEAMEGGTSTSLTSATLRNEENAVDREQSLSESETMNPQEEAAVAAALHRAGLPHHAKTPVDASTGGSNATASSSTSNKSASAVTFTSNATSPQQPTVAQHNIETRADIPLLIPLYDYRSFTGESQAQPPLDVAGVSETAGNTHLPRDDQDLSAVMNGQLARMDRLTREAIDERLRVLEGVSGAVHRCIDDLMRLQSALPVATEDVAAPETEADDPAVRLKSGPEVMVIAEPLSSKAREDENVFKQEGNADASSSS